MDDLLHLAYITLMISLVAFVGYLLGKWAFIIVGAALVLVLALRVLIVALDMHLEKVRARRIKELSDRYNKGL